MVSILGKKRVGHIHILATLVVLGIMIGGSYQGSAAPRKKDVVHIVSDRLEANHKERQVIFLGHVVATQGDLTIQGDRMTIFYSEGGDAKVTGDNVGERLDRIVVQGNVRIFQKETEATAKHAVYYHSDNKVVLTGEPRVRREKDFIQGSSITLFLDSEKGIVEGGPSGPVEATIHTNGSIDSFDKSSGERAEKSGTDRDEGG